MVSKISMKLDIRNHKILKDTSLEYKQLNLLIGNNGSGKTTFLNLINALFSGQDKECDGSIKINFGKYIFDANFTGMGEVAPVEYIRESRYHPANEIQFGAIKRAFDSRRPYDQIAYSDEALEKYNNIIFKIFNRKMRSKPTEDGTMMFYTKYDNLIAPKRDGYGIVNINSIIQTLMFVKNTIVLIEDIDENLHPTAVQKLLRTVFSLAIENNNIVFVTSHSIVAVLEFVKGGKMDSEKYTVTRFHETQEGMELVQLDNDNIDNFLEEFFGSFPDIEDVRILRKLSAFKRKLD